MEIIIYFLLFIWQLPQNILGFFITIFAYSFGKIGERKKIKLSNDTNLTTGALFNSGVSLGNYIILDQKFISLSDKQLAIIIQHELGHQKQSIILGPLYLIIIGIPSFIGNIYFRFKKYPNYYAKNRAYYNLPWERWADELAEINRKMNL